MVKHRSYQRRVFGGKDANWRGLDQGKGPTHHDALHFCLNVDLSGNVFRQRVGQQKENHIVYGSYYSAKPIGGVTVIANGTEIYLGENE